MKRVCERCKYNGELGDHIMKFSNVMNEWLCTECFTLFCDELVKFRESFLNSSCKSKTKSLDVN